MFQVETTDEFDHWLLSLDKRVRIRMIARLAKLARGLWGDCKGVGGGVTELREHFGAGYRIYVAQFGQVLIVALGGGSKSAQAKDIERAIAYAALLAQLKKETS